MRRAAEVALIVFVTLVIGGWLFAAEPKGPVTVDNLAGLEAAATESCRKRGYSLRSITVIYGDAGKVVSAQVGCGGPRRINA